MELVTVLFSIKCTKLVVNLLNKLDTSDQAVSLIAYESKVELSASNEAPLQIVSDSPNSPPESISSPLKEPLRLDLKPFRGAQ